MAVAAPAPVAAPRYVPASARLRAAKARPRSRSASTRSRHLKLRLACAVNGRSAQMIVTDALDQLLGSMPELDAMAEKAKPQRIPEMRHAHPPAHRRFRTCAGGPCSAAAPRSGPETASARVSRLSQQECRHRPRDPGACRAQRQRRCRRHRPCRARGRQDPERRRFPHPARQRLFRRRPLRLGRAGVQGFAVALCRPAARSCSSWRWSKSPRAGRNDALAFLDFARATLDPADYGLALALAGRPADAIPVLQHAAGSPRADARVRQNLALAYALAGDWVNARVVASQDVSAGRDRPAHPAVDAIRRRAKPATRSRR